MSLIVPTKYIKSLIEQNDKVARFLQSIASQSNKTADGYGIGLSYFDKFLSQLSDTKNRNYPKYSYTLNEIVDSLLKNEISVYDILEDFLYYLMSTPSHLPNGTVIEDKKLQPRSLQHYIFAVRSYLAYNDIDIIPSKFKRRVKIPKILKYDEEPIDASDIRKILLACSSRRQKAYLLVLASGGMRTMEACAIRLKDIRFNYKPTKVHIRPEFSKTRLGRDIYISDEATKFLKDWIDYKYRNRNRRDAPMIKKDDDDLVFQEVNTKEVSIRNIYRPLGQAFNGILKTLKMDERKEGMIRRKVTLNSLRRFVRTTISDQTSSDYGEWYLGHAKSTYWTKKEEARRKVYADKCMKYLTFLDYSELETTGKNIEAKLEEKDREIQLIRSENESYKKEMDRKMQKIISAMQKNAKLFKIKPEALKKKVTG